VLAVLASLAATLRERRRVPAKIHFHGPKLATEIAGLVKELGSDDPAERKAAATALYEIGHALGEAAIEGWWKDPDLRKLVGENSTVGIAVQPENFERIRASLGAPPLADVPPDQDAREFGVRFGGPVKLDILTTRAPGENGAIARFLAKSGEGIQQVEFPTLDVDRATELLRDRLGIKPIYPQTRPGADGTRVNFFLLPIPEGKKVLIELVEQKIGSSGH
jgi:hypothetical protein